MPQKLCNPGPWSTRLTYLLPLSTMLHSSLSAANKLQLRTHPEKNYHFLSSSLRTNKTDVAHLRLCVWVQFGEPNQCDQIAI